MTLSALLISGITERQIDGREQEFMWNRIKASRPKWIP